MAENLIIDGSNKTPTIKLYFETGSIEISGKSIRKLHWVLPAGL